jgi:multidrug efflux pump subunit AcrA (membrane-fusion protein)
MVVDAQNTVSVRTIKLGDKADKEVVVLDGLNPGERVIIEGMQKVRPGSLVNPSTGEEPSKIQGG